MLYQRSELNDIKITDVRWKACEDKNALFLSSMDPERVLSGFRRTCKIETDAEPYGGWENSLIAGHGVGHYFSALAMRIAYLKGAGNSAELEKSISKANTIVKGLKECQEYLIPFEGLYGVNMIVPEDAVFATALGSCLVEGQEEK